MRSDPPQSALFTYSFNSSAQQPLMNYALLSAPTVVAGVNSTNVVNPNMPNSLTPGSMNPITYFDPHLPTSRAHEWNLTLEKEITGDTVVSAAYVGTHGSNLDETYIYNEAPNAYIWYTATGTPLPTGTYAGTARRNYDTTTWANIQQYSRIAWSNYQGIKLQVQHRYAKGYAYQWFYLMGNALTISGSVQDPNVFLPGAVPADFKARNRFLNYQRDTTIPKHRMMWNFVVDLPFGKGKPVFGNAGRLFNTLVGGWQVAGTGSMNSNYFALQTGQFGPMNKLQVYGKKYPIQDCRSGTCIAGYLWYNGYIPANQINSYNAAGKPNGVMGVPKDYVPVVSPLYPTPANGGSKTDPNSPYYETNTVFIPLKNGTVAQTTMATNLDPSRNQYSLGPFSYNQNASLFKTFNVTERVRLRFQADVFNVFNAQGLNQPAVSGISSLATSQNTPRQLQLILRLAW